MSSKIGSLLVSIAVAGVYVRLLSCLKLDLLGLVCGQCGFW